ncbi:hypothetical protein DH2020_016921 [Rehmannia glutinosa]|uniref:BAH domain-containing protein n=1 Tax=Rehmannia glutinosa TaxID=99300 RepID=A0ABR0WR17_REHGL
MAANEQYFVEWKEQYVSKERGNRVVHYFLKDNSGESILAVVGTERSVRHMFYVVSDEFFSAHGADNSVHAGFRWRSRREVVNWLTSMLSKQHRQGDSASMLSYLLMFKHSYIDFVVGASLFFFFFFVQTAAYVSPKDNPTSEVNAPQTQMPPHKVQHGLVVQSFVFVMAEKENRYIAYLEDMYEDRKCQKKVKVRWFHHNREVKGVISLQKPHPKEVFITPYVQVISAECVDGPAIVLTREHYEKCLSVFPHDLLGGVHFCFRQFKSNRIKPFKLSKLRGYCDQPIFSCFSPDFFEEKEFSSEDDVKVGDKRKRSFREFNKSTYDLSYKKYGLSRREPKFLKHVEGRLRHTRVFTLNEKVEFLCQDSGLRGCWFRCTVLEVSRRQMKILYDDVKDEDSCTNLEESIPTYRVAKADKLGMRHACRPTVRPAYPCNETSLTFEVGDPADAWWSDGENLYLNIELKNLRVSKDWVGDGWVDVEPNPNIFCIISKEPKSDNSPTSYHKVVTSHKLCAVEEEIHDLEGMTLTNVPLKDDCTNNEQQRVFEAEEKEYYSNHVDAEEKENVDYYNLSGANIVNNDKGNDVDDGNGENNLVECEIAELECESEAMEMLTNR